ncbi:MAG: sigma-70 family RNA polymerase sigma factor [Archangium sp.]
MTTALRAARDDDAALEELLRKYHQRVLRFGETVCRDGAEADDAVQEAFVKLSRRPEVVRHPGALAWLFTTVRRLCLRALAPFSRRARLSIEENQHDAADPRPNAHEALERFELVARVHAVITSLPPELREVLVLRDLEGLSSEEAARALELSEPAMKSRLHKAREAVREALRVESSRAAHGVAAPSAVWSD